MRDFIDVRGVSGAVYRFGLVRDGRPLSPIGGNYLYVRDGGETYEIVHAGEVQNLMNGARDRWSEAEAIYGELHLFTRLNIGEGIRQTEHKDIVSAVGPAMNGEAQAPEPPEPEAATPE